MGNGQREDPRFAKNPVVVRVLMSALNETPENMKASSRDREGQQAVMEPAGEAMEPAGHGASAGQHFPAKALHPPQAL